jgi:hypothetical protein
MPELHSSNYRFYSDSEQLRNWLRELGIPEEVGVCLYVVQKRSEGEDETSVLPLC